MNEKVFQSTLPGRGATSMAGRPPVLSDVSIHAPRAGSDLPMLDKEYSLYSFNPRSPGGERQYLIAADVAEPRFQSTLPGRGATYIICPIVKNRPVSIHAPRAGSDVLFVRLLTR